MIVSTPTKDAENLIPNLTQRKLNIIVPTVCILCSVQVSCQQGNVVWYTVRYCISGQTSLNTTQLWTLFIGIFLRKNIEPKGQAITIYESSRIIENQ